MGLARRRYPPVILLLLAILLASTLFPGGTVARAADPLAAPEVRPGEQIELRASGEEVATFVPPPEMPGGPRIAAATFIVTYNGFSPQAQAAFQRAVDIWSSLLTSPEPIRVQAAWTSLPPEVLGSAGPVTFWRDFAGAPQPGTWYPSALANKLAGGDLDGTKDDIAASFSSDFGPSFYFGTGATPAGQLNFTSVVLHELGHGLGFSGSMRVSGGSGSWGIGTVFPFIYDRFAENGAGQALLNTAVYPNPSAGLANVLRSNNVWFHGPQAVAAAGGTRPRLYAPDPWIQGSSYSHLDEATYGPGNANSLMTPELARGETVYSPGPIALGLLADLGWGATTLTLGAGIARNPPGTGGGPFLYAPGTPVTLTPQPAAGQTFIGWTIDGVYRGWASPLALNMSANHTVQATFAPTKIFPDVGSGRADYAAIVALASRGAIRGYQNGRYGPDDGVQRAQMAALIARATSVGPGTPPATLPPPVCLAGTWDCEDWGTGFTDRGGLDPNLWRNVGTLQHYGVAFGYDGAACAARGAAAPCYGPNEAVTHAQTITFIVRMMKAKGYWQAQPGAPLPYGGVPGPHQEDVKTFVHYTGGVPAPPGNWNAQATRGWFARALWAALNSYWGIG